MAQIDFNGMAALVIDDEPMTRELITGILQELGVSVRPGTL